MDQRLASIIQRVGSAEIAAVAAGALGVQTVLDPGQLTYKQIDKPHADARTIGIVRVAGTASVEVEGTPRPWSSVLKLVDLAVEGFNNSATAPENEARVYERDLFNGTGLKFRPARCFHISHPAERVTLLWLEDLTNAKGAPFEIGQLAQILRHLGEWNALMARDPPQLGFSIGRDFPKRRWEQWNYPARAADLQRLDGQPMVRDLYARQPLGLAGEFVGVLGQLVERSASLPHALSFSDAPIGNFFCLSDETVAIDWSGLGTEPLGADGGCVVGSALTWGPRFADVAANERELFESYAGGFAEGGTVTDRQTLRRGYLAHLAFYLGTIAIFPTMAAGPRALLSRDFFERRLGMSMEEFGPAASRVVDLLPGYIEEARSLLAQYWAGKPRLAR
jgi:hypothetical protein